MKHWAGIVLIVGVAVLGVGVLTHTAAHAAAAPCPERYATVKEMDDCLKDSSCELRQAFPEEHRRNNWINKAAKTYVFDTLSREAECVSMKTLVEGFENSIQTCNKNEATIAIKTALFTLSKREKKISASRRHDRPSTTYTVAEKGTCN